MSRKLPDQLTLNTIGQIHISVTDIDESGSFCRDVLGINFLFQVPGRDMAFFDRAGVRLYLGIPERPEFKPTAIIYYRVDDISGGWKTLMNLAGVESLQLKDFRTYFNHLLKTKYNFTSKDAGAYIGNNEVENELHYSPYHEPTIREKMQRFPIKEVIGWS